MHTIYSYTACARFLARTTEVHNTHHKRRCRACTMTSSSRVWAGHRRLRPCLVVIGAGCGARTRTDMVSDIDLVLSAPGTAELASNLKGSPRRFGGADIGPVGALAAQAARVAVGHLQVLPPQRRLRRPAVPALLPPQRINPLIPALCDLVSIAHIQACGCPACNLHKVLR